MATSDSYATGIEADVPGETTDECPECEGRVTTNTVETVCEECGLVLDADPVDHGPEWRPHDADERTRTGAPLTATRHDRGLSTEIGHTTDAKGNTLSRRKRRQLGRLRREHTRGRWRSKAERNLADGLTEVRRIASALEVADALTEQACRLFRQAQAADLLQGRSIDGMAAASVYGALRCAGLAWTLDDVDRYAGCSTSQVRAAYAALNVELDLPTPPRRPSAFVPRFASEAGVSAAVRRRAHDLAERAEEAGVVQGAQPTGFAAACLYRAAQELDHSVRQADLADIAETSAATIRTHRKTLADLDPRK